MAFKKGEDSKVSDEHARLMREIKEKKEEMRQNQSGGKK